MEQKELNSEFKSEINKRFEELHKQIGPSRQQLSTKVTGIHHGILKELAKEKASAERQAEIRAEVSKTEKMAANQLPHHLLPKPAAAPAKPKSEGSKTPAPKNTAPKKSAAKKK